MDEEDDFKGKSPAMSNHIPSLHQQPDNASTLLSPQQAGSSLATQSRRQWNNLPLDIGQRLMTTTVNANINCEFPSSCMGALEAQGLGLNTLPSLVPGRIQTTEGYIECRWVVFLNYISGPTSQEGQVWTSRGRFAIHVIPAECGEVPLTIGSDLLYTLIREQPRFNSFCHRSLDGFGALRMLREPRRTPSRRHQRRRGLGNPSSYVNVDSPLITTQRPLPGDHSTLRATSSSSHQQIPRHNYGSPLPSNHGQPSPVVQQNQMPFGSPGFVPPSAQPAFYLSPTNAFGNMTLSNENAPGSFPAGDPGSSSGTGLEYMPTPWHNQDNPGAANGFNNGDGTYPPPSGPEYGGANQFS